jgi:23S rRNA (uracil1939-C5)-methyltransferase
MRAKERPELEAFDPSRVTPRCRHFGSCGGCEFQHLEYPRQIHWKHSLLKEILAREAGVAALPEIRATPTDDPWGFRTKMEFTFGGGGPSKITLGLHQRASFRRIINVERCEIAPDSTVSLLEELRRAAEISGLPAYDSIRHTGFWRYAVIRTGISSRRILLLLITAEGEEGPVRRLAEVLPEKISELASFYWGISNKVSDIARPDRLQLLWGADSLDDRIGDIRFALGPASFLQPNRTLVGRAYETIRERAELTGREPVCDLYCGIGLISLFLARQASAVCGVESEPENAAQAERNAALNGISNVQFFCGKTEDLLRGGTLFRMNHRPEVVVLDPPRTGLHPAVCAPLLEAGPKRILYLSCNPASLARDLKILLGRDPAYRLDSLDMFDFFPHTAHMEVLATLHRSSPSERWSSARQASAGASPDGRGTGPLSASRTVIREG